MHRGKIDFVHIGYHKTGTTYLQNCGLKKHSQIKMLADYNDDNNEFEQTLFQLINGMVRILYRLKEIYFNKKTKSKKISRIPSP